MPLNQIRFRGKIKGGDLQVAIYQPTNIFPSSFAGVGGGVVDVTQPLTVSWQVNGSSAMTDYQITIYENTTASALVYNSGKMPVNPPFFGVTSTGEVQYFEVTIPSSSLSNLSNGYASGYKMLITQWWNGGSVQQISPSFFITRKDPTISINSFQTTVTSRNATFTGNYTQEQSDTLDWFRWELATVNDLDNPLEDSGYIYGTGDITVSYDGLFTGTTYAIRCTVQTENGVQATTGWQQFNVEYEVSTLDGYVNACPSPVEGIVVQFPKVSYIPGVANGDYDIENGNLILPEGSSVTWDERNNQPMQIYEPWTIAWSGYLPVNGTNPIFKVEGDGHTVLFGITNQQISLTLDGQILAENDVTHIITSDPIRVVLTPREIHVYKPEITGGLYPSEGLYPSPTLYPDAGDKLWSIWKYPLTWVQPTIESFTLYGEQICQWVAILNGEPDSSKLSDYLTNLYYEPVWDLDTWFLATFNGTGLNAGNITPRNDTIKGSVVYRLKTGESRLVKIADLDAGVSTLVDEGFQNQSEYTYYVFVLGENTYVSAPLISNKITPMFWNWTILDCSVDTNGVYHAEAVHLFSNNVSTDGITNNNAPQLLQNFTRYPTRQPSSYNYKSSVLTGYIGKVDMNVNQYIDTVDMADKIWELSTSNSPKFLRDRKGNFLYIQTSSAISMQTGDNTIPQTYFGSVPWAELNTTKNMSVICEPTDGAWDDIMGTQPEEQGVAKIVVTAPFGSLVTITNGTETYTEICYSFVTYYPKENGEWTVSAEKEYATDSKTVNVTEDVTYYVGMIPTPFTATLQVIAPSGTIVTITNGQFSFTKEVP